MDCGTAAANEFSEGQEPVQTPSPRFLRTQEPTVEQIRVLYVGVSVKVSVCCCHFLFYSAEKHYTYRKMVSTLPNYVDMSVLIIYVPGYQLLACMDSFGGIFPLLAAIFPPPTPTNPISVLPPCTRRVLFSGGGGGGGEASPPKTLPPPPKFICNYLRML